ncbi:protein of unknown function DUF105 [Desulfofarcimen acetoxidans DSM 771]|uniref:Adenosylcobinamide amidohydrolase n=1 Tax=Desulfofarcimen acetoxidans (strain ATCC 49208 / DSM 771 / KCTC 5769 / VKM B-1644 / 5575) TaxID=485916 RepID=C8VYB3_DESAS|nr:adenosylcobinamide amidohydrolase [Desulfofarcimen acetoxidans]ACV62794.1 protein of unknown function DUF105 [Desulfofarcimen acetoxidans DSM 771]
MLEELHLFNKQISIQGINFYVYNKNTFLVSSDNPLKVLSSAVLGGNLRQAYHIINHSVNKNYNGSDPEQDLRQVAEGLNLGHDVVGMMTAVNVTHTVLSCGSQKGLAVAALCTVGVSNPGVAGVPTAKLQRNIQPGTINTILLIEGNLSVPAMVNAVITATEAKTRALFKSKISLLDGECITGTTSDAIVVSCTGRGELQHYAGTATDLGYLIGRTVYNAISQGVDDYISYNEGLNLENKIDFLN